ncbi:uncharacterized protein DFL_000398 [Arthrobotrys flagrans]|uniref:Uncharacterized protein n=1 Tax=Arthrobotrys flagrans TaxID=97331 RepID=A0A437AF11_ARTFL|nr:hypothetical protein DFL_000398 [Arthrobotrys flagrans]
MFRFYRVQGGLCGFLPSAVEGTFKHTFAPLPRARLTRCRRTRALGTANRLDELLPNKRPDIRFKILSVVL